MPASAPLPTSLRHTLLLRVGGLVAGSALLVSAIFVMLGLGPMSTRIAEIQFNAAAAQVEASLTALFAPTESLVRMSRGWLRAQVPDTGRAEAFERHFEPLLEHLPQVTSVVAGTSGGEGWMLLEHPDGHWTSRITNARQWGQRHLLVDHRPDRPALAEWRQMDYEVSSRPWFQGALGAQGGIHWTAPYTLYTTGDPGITVSAAQRLADGRDLVIGLDVMLRDLSRTTMQAALGRFGRALVITDDERVLAMPAPPADVGEEAWLARVLEPAGRLGLEEIDAALDRWRSAGRRENGVIAYRSGGQDWLARIQPYPLGGQRFWVVAVAPAAEFAPDWLPVLLGTGGTVALVLVATLFLLRFEALRIAMPLESLAAASRRFDGGETPAGALPGGIAEVEQLASAQAVMADRMQRSRELLADRDQRLGQQLQALQESEAKYRLLFEAANDAIFLLDKRGFIDANERGLHLYGLSREQLTGRTPAELAPDHQADGRLSSQVARERAIAALAGQPQFFEWQLRRADGALCDVEITLSPMTLTGHDCIQAIMRDITRRKRAEEEIRQLAYFDPLTGLPNRRLFLDRLGHALIASERSREFGALIMLDLDHFKLLNDTQGHDAGDRLLVQVAERVQACVRREDTVSRLGGDEYLVMLEALGQDEQAAAHQAEIVAEKIRAALNRPYLLGGDAGRDFHSTGSLGLTLFGHLPASPDVILKQADMALYRAKDAGRNAIRFYNPDMQAAIDERVRLEAGLRQALAQGEFRLHYQPQVTGADGRIVAVEALLRWQHPKDGMVMPDRFIPVAEHTGQILAIGGWVIREACRQLAAWKAAGLPVQRVAVNVSARQLHSPQLLEDIREALADHGLAGGELELEVTESTAMEEPELAIGLLRILRSLGVGVAIDDFGTGYSSLSLLHQLPIQTLKLDRSFVRNIEMAGGDAAICAATLSLARNLGLRAVAEGVETEAQRYFLSTVHGCDLLQGYLFGRPLPATELAALLGAQTGRTA